MNPLAKPFFKWAGGKGSSADAIAKLLPPIGERVYREPFLGGGAMYFKLQPKHAVLSDVLVDLVHAFEMVRDRPEQVVAQLSELQRTHDRAQYEMLRDRYNESRVGYDSTDARLGRVSDDRSIWFLYLNKTCFNGLYRTNKKGEFNVPFGDYKDPKIVDPERIAACSEVLRATSLRVASFTHLIEEAGPGDVVYLDPPYVPVSKTSNFSGYHEGRFTPEQQESLAAVYRELDRRGCLLALSQSDAPVVRELYKGYDVTEIQVGRSINSKASARGNVTELLIRNTGKYP